MVGDARTLSRPNPSFARRALTVFEISKIESIRNITMLLILPSAFTASRLFATGATLGPLIDGLHNQALLRYDLWPVAVQFSETLSFRTSAVVPPLLGVTYIVLGGVLPQAMDALLKAVPFRNIVADEDDGSVVAGAAVALTTGQTNGRAVQNEKNDQNHPEERHFFWLTVRAIAAVASTAAIVRWTEVMLSTTSNTSSILRPDAFLNPSAFSAAGTFESYLLLLTTVCIVQWAWLDGTMTTLLVASLAAVAGPLAELPFLSLGWWVYYDSPALYYPLGEVLSSSSSSSSLGIHCLTGPCYFAVTMDAIALGRWFAAMETRTMLSRQDQQQADADKDDTSGDALEKETTNLLLVKDRPASPVLRPTAVVGTDEPPPPDHTTTVDHTATTMNKR
jgi:hypothetical protein